MTLSKHSSWSVIRKLENVYPSKEEANIEWGSNDFTNVLIVV